MASDVAETAKSDGNDAQTSLLDLRPKIKAPILERRLSSTTVTPEHFLNWDPRVFIKGKIWKSVSFPPGRDITDNELFMFVAVLFFVDKNLRKDEPRVWNELRAAWDAKFGVDSDEAVGWGDRRYGQLLWGGELGDGDKFVTVMRPYTGPPERHGKPRPVPAWPGISLDLAISGECQSYGPVAENWMKDCLRYYRPPIDSLKKLFKIRGDMRLEGPRWWRPEAHHDGGVSWMPERYWGKEEDSVEEDGEDEADDL